MVKVTVRVRDEQLQAYMRQAPQRNEEAQTLFKQRGAQIVIAQMREQVPIKSGFLRESIDSQETPAGFTVFPRASYAGFVDRGTAPHIIQPKTAKALRWFSSYGAPIFAKYVQHPGTKPTFFVRRTAEAAKDKLTELMKQIWREVHGFR